MKKTLLKEVTTALPFQTVQQGCKKSATKCNLRIHWICSYGGGAAVICLGVPNAICLPSLCNVLCCSWNRIQKTPFKPSHMQKIAAWSCCVCKLMGYGWEVILHWAGQSHAFAYKLHVAGVSKSSSIRLINTKPVGHSRYLNRCTLNISFIESLVH